MAENQTDSGIDSRVNLAIRGLLVLLVPIGGIIGAYFSTRAALISDIREIRQRHEFYEQTTRAALDRIGNTVDSLRSEFNAHSRMGPNGLPHPAGVMVKIDQLQHDLKALEKQFNETRKQE